jgi:hypothetical protein
LLNRVLLGTAILIIAVIGLWRYEVTDRALPAIIALGAASIATPVLVGVARDYL